MIFDRGGESLLIEAGKACRKPAVSLKVSGGVKELGVRELGVSGDCPYRAETLNLEL